MTKNIEDIKINYLELAYIMDIDLKYSKLIFTHATDRNIYDWVELPIKDLKNFFRSKKSLDKRYDSINELVFNMTHKSEEYKAFFNDIDFITKGTLSGGASVLLKIMNKEQLKHFYTVKKTKYNDLIMSGIKNKTLFD